MDMFSVDDIDAWCRVVLYLLHGLRGALRLRRVWRERQTVDKK
ncbi:hypothetical protein [Streptomyces sp. NPDC059757]